MRITLLKRHPVIARLLLYGLGVLFATAAWKYRYPLDYLMKHGALPEMRSTEQVVSQHRARVDARFKLLALFICTEK